MRPHDIRKRFAGLIHSVQNNVTVDCGTVSGEWYVVIPMGMSFGKLPSYRFLKENKPYIWSFL